MNWNQESLQKVRGYVLLGLGVLILVAYLLSR
jgi:hypothetical protein